MPPIRPERARNLLSATDRAPQRSRRPLSLRQGALLALIAAGLTAHEIANLQASAITMELGHLLVTVRRHGVTWEACLPADLAPHLLAWLSERRLWGEPAPSSRAARDASPQPPSTKPSTVAARSKGTRADDDPHPLRPSREHSFMAQIKRYFVI